MPLCSQAPSANYKKLVYPQLCKNKYRWIIQAGYLFPNAITNNKQQKTTRILQQKWAIESLPNCPFCLLTIQVFVAYS